MRRAAGRVKEVLELFGTRVDATGIDWHRKVENQECPFDQNRCYKVRKSQPDVSIGTCIVGYGARGPVLICPKRLVDQGRIFRDVLHLLTRHEPGNDYHLIPEFSVPGGSVDFVVTSVKDGRVVDFVGVELQTLDTTGTVWPARQRFLIDQKVIPTETLESKSYGMNWKMTAKTILVQMHHKAETFAHVGRHLVLVVQDALLSYMEGEFDFDHFTRPANVSDTVHVHGYNVRDDLSKNRYGLALANRVSTDVAGIAQSLGLKDPATVEESEILDSLSGKLSEDTLFNPISNDVPDAVGEVFDTPEPEST